MRAATLFVGTAHGYSLRGDGPKDERLRGGAGVKEQHQADGGLVFAMHRLTWRTNRLRPGYFAQDRLIQRLASDPPTSRVMIVDHPTSVLSWGVRTLRDGRVERPTGPGVTLATPMRLRRDDDTAIAGLRRGYARYGVLLRARARLAGLARPHILTTNALFAAFADLRWAASVTYHATDDFGHTRLRAAAYRAAYDVMAVDHSIRVSAVTPTILDAMRRTDGHVIPNGLEPAEWAEPSSSAPDWFAALPTPRLVYFGGVTDRVDLDATARAAAAVPDGVLAIIGRVFDEGHVAPLRSVPNIVFHDPVGREDVVSILRASDLGLVPHVVRDATLAMSPLKAYEYLAAGLPVLSTPLPAMAALGPRVVTSETAGFGGAVADALRLGRDDDRSREEFVARHSWRHRHDELFALVLGPA